MPPIHMKAGDTWPRLSGKVDADLNGGSVKFIMYTADAVFNLNPVLTRPATIVGDPALGNIEYAWKPLDTSNPGRYFCVFRATLRDGRVISVPNKGYMEVRIDL